MPRLIFVAIISGMLSAACDSADLMQPPHSASISNTLQSPSDSTLNADQVNTPPEGASGGILIGSGT
jgi:hypothetical protein